MKSIQIRKATVVDSTVITQVHIKSWQQSYRGLLSDFYLDNLESEFSKRNEIWTASINRNTATTFVAEVANTIVGFCTAGPARDKDKAECGEIYSIYLLEEFKKQGIGFKLLSMGLHHLILNAVTICAF